MQFLIMLFVVLLVLDIILIGWLIATKKRVASSQESVILSTQHEDKTNEHSH
jgi:hypothetical protein